LTKGHDILNREGDLTLNIGTCGELKDTRNVFETYSESSFPDNSNE